MRVLSPKPAALCKGRKRSQAPLDPARARAYEIGRNVKSRLTRMIPSFRKLFGMKEAGPPVALPQGRRVYAIGDIHGRLDLLKALVAAIEAEDGALCGKGLTATIHAQTTIILLGDLIDRGPDSAGVLTFARDLQSRRDLRILLGNHEEMLLGARASLDVLRHLLRHGGRETVLSFGVTPEVYGEATYEEVQNMLHTMIPADIWAFIQSFEDQIHIGDYVFVHAGIRPGVALGEQRVEDLRWIREPFLSSPERHGPLVVHGHTIVDEPALRHNRIGLDTGAYSSGRLTALGLEGTARWLWTAHMDEDGAIRVERHEA